MGDWNVMLDASTAIAASVALGTSRGVILLCRLLTPRTHVKVHPWHRLELSAFHATPRRL